MSYFPSILALYTLSANQSISNSGFTALSGWTKQSDNSSPNFYNGGGSTTNFVAPRTGRYTISAKVYWDASVSLNQRYCAINAAGVRYRMAVQDQSAVSGVGLAHNGTITVALNAGDVIKVEVTQGSSGNLNVFGGGSGDTDCLISIMSA